MTLNKIIYQTTTKSGKKVSYRYPTINDAEILKDYINKISAEKSFITFQGEQQTLEEETNWLKDKLEKVSKGECVYLLGFINQKLVTSSEITLKPLNQNHIGSFGITVAKEFRGDGVGKKTMEFVIPEAIKKINNLKIITLEVFSDNPIAQNLYKKMGFIKYGCLPEGFKHQDKFVYSISMYKKVK